VARQVVTPDDVVTKDERLMRVWLWLTRAVPEKQIKVIS
jgi:hypothetical protein